MCSLSRAPIMHRTACRCERKFTSAPSPAAANAPNHTLQHGDIRNPAGLKVKLVRITPDPSTSSGRTRLRVTKFDMNRFLSWLLGPAEAMPAGIADRDAAMMHVGRFLSLAIGLNMML